MLKTSLNVAMLAALGALAKGTGSGSIKVGIPVGVSGANASLGDVKDTCTVVDGKVKDSRGKAATSHRATSTRRSAAAADRDVAYPWSSPGQDYNLTLNLKANVLQRPVTPGGGQVPEPASPMPMGLGAAGLGALRKRRLS